MLGYEILLAHLFGDYWLQNDWMACNKKIQLLPAVIHGIVYTLPFLLITQSITALLIICITHILIDHTDIVGRFNQIKNWKFKQDNIILSEQLSNGQQRASIIELNDGYYGRPLFIRIWLIIIQDNALHLLINYLSILYL
jgi:hypothetical protein